MDRQEIHSAIVKAAFKEAMTEWLDEKFAMLGRWTFRGIAAALVVGLLYLILALNGWHKLP